MYTNIQKSVGSVRYAFKDSIKVLQKNQKKESLIYLHFTFGKDKFKYSTGYKSCLANWDLKKQRIRNISSILNRDDINTDLDLWEKEIKRRYSELSKENELVVTSKMLKRELDIITKKITEQGSKELSFFDVIDAFIEQKGNQISVITKRSYKQTKKRLEAYEEHYKEVLTFDAIDIVFYNKFNAFMEEKNFALNTIGKHIKSIKTFMNHALNEGYTTNAKFKNQNFKVKKEITTEIYLTEKEIAAMHKKDLSKYPEMSHARDIFLIGCYTGQRISDYNKLTENDIITKDGVQYFKFKQHKNRKFSREVMCPITKEIREIMEKRHEGKPPKPMQEPTINLKLKDLGELLEMTELIKCEYTKGGEHKLEMIPKCQLIKTHTARRSFCTNKYKAGMSIFDIMLFSGHSTEKEFYKYIRIKDEERAAHIVKSGFFNV